MSVISSCRSRKRRRLASWARAVKRRLCRWASVNRSRTCFRNTGGTSRPPELSLLDVGTGSRWSVLKCYISLRWFLLRAGTTEEPLRARLTTVCYATFHFSGAARQSQTLETHGELSPFFFGRVKRRHGKDRKGQRSAWMYVCTRVQGRSTLVFFFFSVFTLRTGPQSQHWKRVWPRTWLLHLMSDVRAPPAGQDPLVLWHDPELSFISFSPSLTPHLLHIFTCSDLFLLFLSL